MGNLEQEKALIKAQISIAESLSGIRENLKQLNDNNILHTAETKSEHTRIVSMLKVLIDKYWYLIVILISILAGIAGYKSVISVI